MALKSEIPSSVPLKQLLVKRSCGLATLKPHVAVFIMNGRHRYCALKAPATARESFGWKFDDITAQNI